MNRTLCTSMFILLIAATACKKSSNDNNSNTDPNRVVNGVNVSEATAAINGYRTKGVNGRPATGALVWNDILSNAAFNFAKAKWEDTGIASSVYELANGDFILDYPTKAGFQGQADFAFYYGYPSTASVKGMIDAGFIQYANDNLVMNGFMDPSQKQFGMGQFGSNWYIIISN